MSEHVESVYYVAGSVHHPGTTLPRNVTGECPHRHRTIAGAARCIEAHDRAIKQGHGPHAFSDRQVIEVDPYWHTRVVVDAETVAKAVGT